jgi:hypothetical protein
MRRDENAGAKEEERESGRENSPNQLFVRVKNSARPKPTKRANMVMLRCLSKRVLERSSGTARTKAIWRKLPQSEHEGSPA